LVLLTDLPGLPLIRPSQVFRFSIGTLSFAIVTLSLRHDSTPKFCFFILNVKAEQRIPAFDFIKVLYGGLWG
jgi:hypothetical protein